MLLTKPGRRHLREEASEACLKVAQSVVGRSSAFGELRLWDEGHPLAKARNLLSWYLTSSVLVMGLWFLARFGP